MIEHGRRPFEQEWLECQLVGARPDGALVVIIDGANHALEPAGIELPQPPSAAYVEFVGRLAGLRKPLRCRIVDRTQSDRERAEIHYFAWQDKSGDVWRDLAETLIEQGLARATGRN